jgi:ABC-2 type transport system ATP-binding protein
VAILKRGKLIASGSVDSVLSDEDCLLLNATENRLIELMQGYKGVSRVADTPEGVACFFDKGKVSPAEVNSFCFNNGIVLSQITMKKKKLEEKFFELTSE